MPILTQNKSALYGENTYRYSFKEIFRNEDKENMVVLIDKLTNKDVIVNMSDLNTNEKILEQIDPKIAFNLGHHMVSCI